MVLAAAGCGGGGQLSAEEYFADLEGLAAASNTEVEAITAELDAEAATVFTDDVDPDSDEFAAAFLALQSRFFDELAPIFAGVESGLADLEPPDELASHHDDFVAATAAVTVAFEQLGAAVDGVATLDELDQLDDRQFTSAQTGFDQACRALQDEADVRGIEADLRCEVE